MHNIVYLHKWTDWRDYYVPWHESVWQLNVVYNGPLGVPLWLDGVGRRQDGGPGIELTNDTSLGDGKGLLLHNLVQNGSNRVQV